MINIGIIGGVVCGIESPVIFNIKGSKFVHHPPKEVQDVLKKFDRVPLSLLNTVNPRWYYKEIDFPNVISIFERYPELRFADKLCEFLRREGVL